MTRARLRRRLVFTIYAGTLALAVLLIPLGASPVPVCHGWMVHHGGAITRYTRLCRLPRHQSACLPGYRLDLAEGTCLPRAGVSP